MSGANGDSAPPSDGSAPDPSRLPKGCLPASAAAVLVVLAGVLFGTDTPYRMFGGNDDASSNQTTPPKDASDTATPTDPATTASTTEPTSEPTPTVTDPIAPYIELGGEFQKVAGQRIRQSFENAVDLQVRANGLTGSMDLVLDSSLNFDEEEPVCFTFALDVDRPLPFVPGSEPGQVVVDGKVSLIVGYSDGPCTGAAPAETAPREARLMFEYDPRYHDHDGVLALDTGDLFFNVSDDD